MNKPGINTRLVHAGEKPCPVTGAMRMPIYQTATFVFENVEQGARRFAGEEEGYIYTRLGNPTQTALEIKMADLEGGEAAIATASGMAAVSSATMGLLKQGDHVVSSEAVYGCTHSLFKELFPRWGLEVSFVDTSDPEEIAAAIKPETRMLYLESPANPTMSLVDLEKAVALAREKGLKTVIDNTFMTPYYQRPLEKGIDLVVHSGTKYIGGHGDAVAGIIVGSKEDLDIIRGTTLKDFGGIISPFNAWLLLRGIKTLGLRMERITSNCQKVAEFLQQHPQVERVYYPGLKSHPQHELAQKQMDGFGGMLSFELKDGYSAGKKLMENVELCTLAVSLGDLDTLIQHPASMTHSVLELEDQEEAGILPGLVRLSVGIEDGEDIIKDLDYGLKLIEQV